MKAQAFLARLELNTIFLMSAGLFFRFFRRISFGMI